MTDAPRKSGSRGGCLAIVTVLVLMLASGCAVKQPFGHTPQDPWEGFNRQVFAFNESVDIVVLKPIASVYHQVLPQPARQGVSNFFNNLEELPSALNNFMQADFAGSTNDLLRFIINSTLGVLGLFDVATGMEMHRQPEDFEQTLAVWGVDAGPYVMLPLLGPSSLRGIPGKVVDFLISPIGWLFNSDTSTALLATGVVSDRSAFFEQEDFLRQLSPDFYVQLRDFYLNNRENKIMDGNGEINESTRGIYEDL